MARILLIDDEELVIKSVEKFLKKQGYEVVCARSGQEAVRKVQEEDFDLVVTDIRMPQMNGIDTIRQIREISAQKGMNRIPEICITGYADEELNKQAEKLNVAEYLYKPFDLRDFLVCVERNLKS